MTLARFIRRRFVHHLNEGVVELFRPVLRDVVEDLVRLVEELECFHEFMLRILIQDLLRNHRQELDLLVLDLSDVQELDLLVLDLPDVESGPSPNVAGGSNIWAF